MPLIYLFIILCVKSPTATLIFNLPKIAFLMISPKHSLLYRDNPSRYILVELYL
jgi:hypothetical protein